MFTPRSAVLAVLVVSGGLLAGCGGDDDDAADTTTAPAATAPAPAATAAPATTAVMTTEPAGAGGAVVSVGTTELGEVLVNADGLSLYGFLNDSGGTPSCYDQCAQAWPPVLVDSAELPEGLDPAVFSTTERIDGTFQLVAGDWPLYTYFEDAAPGDVVGQGSGGVWYVVDPTGQMIDDTPTGLTSDGGYGG